MCDMEGWDDNAGVCIIGERLDNSFREVMSDCDSRRTLRDFLERIFNVKDPKAMYRLIARACWDSRNTCDMDIYEGLMESIQEDNSGIVATVSSSWRQVRQLSHQRKELLRETSAVLGYIGKHGRIRDYLSIGDNGKMVVPLCKELGIDKDRVTIAHDREPIDTDVAASLERGSVDPIGHFVYIDYEDAAKSLSTLPSHSQDLITINMGLHHFPQKHIIPLLTQLRRILRVGGVLILREHDTDISKHPKLLPMLHVAHMVFNAATKVAVRVERHERRAFRSVLEWRTIVESVGLVDTLVYDMEKGDPTWDEMMCFVNPAHDDDTDDLPTTKRPSDVSTANITQGMRTSDSAIPIQGGQKMLAAAPAVLLEIGKECIRGAQSGLPKLQQVVEDLSKEFLSRGHAAMVQSVTQRFVKPLQVVLDRFGPYMGGVTLKEGDMDFIGPEVCLVIETLKRRVDKGIATPAEMTIVSVLSDLEDVLPSLTPGNNGEGEGEGGGEGEGEGEGGDTTTARTGASLSSGSDTDDTDERVYREAMTSRGLSRHRVFSAEEIKVEVKSVLQHIPHITHPSFIDAFGLHPVAGSALRALMPAPGEVPGGVEGLHNHIASRMCTWLLTRLDATAWEELTQALHHVRQSPPEAPTKSKMLDPRDPWHGVALAVLGSSRMHMTKMQSWQARAVGLGEFVTLWKQAHQNRTQPQIQRQPSGPAAEVASGTLKSIKAVLKKMREDDQVYTTEINDNEYFDIHGVQEVIHAKFGYKTLTADYVECTEQVKALYLHGSTLRLRGRNVTKDLSDAGLPVASVVDPLRLAMYNKRRKLKLTYVMTRADSSLVLTQSQRLSDLLRAGGHIRTAREGSGHWTWFKLPEWLQVEIMQIFGRSMETQPWYRFPFIDFIKLYCSVLKNEVKVVKEQFDWKTAMMSHAFISDAVPAVVMGALFAQLKALAFPLQKILGEEYDTTGLVEEVCVTLPTPPRDMNEWERIHPGIRNVRNVAEELYVLQVPTFKAMTTAFKKMALSLNDARLLQISNQSIVQVRARCDDAGLKLLQHAPPTGCELKFTFQLPVDNEHRHNRRLRPLQHCVSLAVQVPFLLDLIRAWHLSNNVHIEQIYDFYS
eukprot:GFYU01002789.1.p1 GENE.GFYU01002789.1~~GFYU01002789.1.p1  ORF type:complete len:1110 (-),score=314.84 GFYU01002789.1:142-3471(-)